MADKCFCHLNGYKVKDSDARKAIEELEKTTKNLDDNYKDYLGIRALTRDNYFNSLASIHNANNSFDILVVENYDDVSGIDETKDDGNYVIVNNYEADNHKISIPTGTVKMFRSVVVNLEHSISKFFASLDVEGEGSAEVFFSTDGGTTFNPMKQDELQECVQGTDLVVQLKLIGEISLYNMCWGVKA